MAIRITKAQSQLVKAPIKQRLFIEGAAGTGKTTVGVRRLRHLLSEGVPADQILLLVPQQSLAAPYRAELSNRRAGGDVRIATIGSLSREMVELFFPLIAQDAGFADPEGKPHFLSLELVQYYMDGVLRPLIEQRDLFNSVTISRNRLYSQVVDNLNKAALTGLDAAQVGQRLKSAWNGKQAQEMVYDDAQTAMDAFRDYCLINNLVDFSLQVELLVNYLWQRKQARDYMTTRWRYLIVDNVEEDTPATHYLLQNWLAACESATLIYDTDGGYRYFLAADADSGYALRESCDAHERLTRQFVMGDDVQALQAHISTALGHETDIPKNKAADARRALAFDDQRFSTQMLDWTADQVAALIHDQGVAPDAIVILAPFVPDALRFLLFERLQARDVPARSHRPSRALREQPAARALLSFARLSHPDWQMAPEKFDLTDMLAVAVDGLDPLRARLLVEDRYDAAQGLLLPFHEMQHSALQQRITFELGQRYDLLRQWIADYEAMPPVALDVFLSRAFGEVLSRRGFGFHQDYDAAYTAAKLIESARNFRQAVTGINPKDENTAPEYIRLVAAGLLANSYAQPTDADDAPRVLLAPAYTFLVSNQAVDYQFWLNVGSDGWSTRLYQPLTQPYVLRRSWPEGRKWTDEDEQQHNRETLHHLIVGLVRRCRLGIYLGYSEFSAQGYEQRGALLMAIQKVLRGLAPEKA
jgi:hypothetical protein